jgi:hypothetical protein
MDFYVMDDKELEHRNTYDFISKLIVRKESLQTDFKIIGLNKSRFIRYCPVGFVYLGFDNNISISCNEIQVNSLIGQSKHVGYYHSTDLQYNIEQKISIDSEKDEVFIGRGVMKFVTLYYFERPCVMFTDMSCELKVKNIFSPAGPSGTLSIMMFFFAEHSIRIFSRKHLSTLMMFKKGIPNED